MKSNCRINATQLKSLRDQLGLTQDELAKLSGVSAATIRRLETQKQKRVSPPTVRRLAKAIGVPDGAILTFFALDKAPPPWDVVGRDADINAIRARLLQQHATKPAACVLSALPGMGKSIIASTLAYDPQIRAHFDNVYFLSFGPVPSIVTKLRELATVNDLTDVAQFSDIETLTDQISHAVGPKKVLLVLDDIWEPHHVAPFLVVAPGSAILVTTRHVKLAPTFFSESALHKLSPLSSGASVELFRAFAPDVSADSDQVNSLIENLGGLPLGLIVAATYLQSHSDDPDAVTREAATILDTGKLIGERTPLDITGLTPTVYAVFDRSLSRLSPDAHKTFRNLAPFALGETFDIRAASSVCETENTEGHLAELQALALVSSEPNPLSDAAPDEPKALYSLHQLTAAVSRFKLHEGFDTRPVYLRHAKHYLNLLISINDLYNDRQNHLQLANSRLRLHMPQIAEALRFANQQRVNSDFDNLCCKSILGANQVLWNCLPPREYLGYLEQAAAAAKRLELHQEPVTLTLRAVALRIDLGDIAPAVQDATWAADLDPHYAGTANVALANACLGLATQYQNRFALSIAAFQRALDLYSQLPEDDKIRPLAITTQNLAVSFAEAGNQTDAAQCLRDADALVQQLNDYKLALLLLEKRARTSLTDRDPLTLAYAAHVGLNDLQDRFGAMRALVTFGDCCRLANKPDHALTAYFDALDLATGSQAQHYGALAELGAARVYQMLGQHSDAAACARLALSIFEQIQNTTYAEEARQIIEASN